jgi:hypothetical protein
MKYYIEYRMRHSGTIHHATASTEQDALLLAKAIKNIPGVEDVLINSVKYDYDLTLKV